MKVAIPLIPRSKKVNSMTKQLTNSASREITNILITLKKHKNYIGKQMPTKKKLEKRRKRKSTKINDK
jgi:hypothetical protein